MSNDITELRSHLFDTLRGLKDGTIKPEQAKLINATAQTLINSAKVEVDLISVVGGKGTGFIPATLLPHRPGTPSSLTLAGQLGAKDEEAA